MQNSRHLYSINNFYICYYLHTVQTCSFVWKRFLNSFGTPRSVSPREDCESNNVDRYLVQPPLQNYNLFAQKHNLFTSPDEKRRRLTKIIRDEAKIANVMHLTGEETEIAYKGVSAFLAQRVEVRKRNAAGLDRYTCQGTGTGGW